MTTMTSHLLSDEQVQQVFELLAEHLPLGIVVLDCDFRLLFINQRHAELNRLPLDAQLGKTLREYLPHVADAIEPKLQFVAEYACPLIHQRIKGRHPRFDGVLVHRLASYYPLLDEQGKTRLILGVIQDASVDDFEATLRQESEERLLRVLDNLFAFVGVLELDGTLLHANRAPLEAAGIQPADVEGKKFWDCYWWSYSAEVQEQLRQAAARCIKGEVSRYDVPVRMRDGVLIWIEFMLAPLRDEYGRITHLIPSGIDISKRHESEQALHRSEEHLRSVIESSDDAIITKSLDGRVTSWNPAAERLLGYEAAEMIGKPITTIFPPELMAEEAVLMRKISQGERIPGFETQRIHRSGRLLDVSVTISPLRDKSGQVVGACKLARDVSHQKQQMHMLEQALEEKTTLLHEVHHRVKNNLQIVSSLLNLQARKASPEVAAVLAESQGRIKAMALIHQLLYESHHMSEVNLNDFLKNLIALSAPLYATEKKGIRLLLNPGNDTGISLHVQQMIPCGLVVNELILNAIKHAFPFGRSGLITISAVRSGNRIVISVQDDGQGLPDDFSWQSQQGLGSQLIPMFVRQLHGQLSHESSTTGTLVSVTLAQEGGLA